MDSSLLSRLERVLSLDADVYGELAADTGATGQAILVVIAVAFAQGLGDTAGEGLSGALVGVAIGCLRWLLWCVAIHLVAGAAGIASDLGALFRALGFAAAPLALGALESILWIGVLFWAAKWLLGVAALVLAVRRVLAVETPQALWIGGVGLAVAIVVALPLGWLH